MSKIRTMEELAAASGISRPTLSKFFNDPGSVRPRTRARIEEAIRRHDYHHNIFASNQNRRHPRTLGILMPHLTDPFYAEVVRHLETLCASKGYWAIVLSSHGDREREEAALRTLLSLKLAGAVVAPLGTQSNRRVYATLARELPLVLLDNRVEIDVPFVGTDNETGIELMVEYLVRTGEPPCFLEMPAVNENAAGRRKAYLAAAKASGFEARIIQSRRKDWDFEQAGFEAVEAALAGRGLPSTTLLCANDRLAFGALSAAHKRGLKVGRGEDCDLRIAGHDDHPLSRYACPSLTTIAQDFSALSTAAFEILLERPEPADRPSAQFIPSHLVMRDSA